MFQAIEDNWLGIVVICIVSLTVFLVVPSWTAARLKSVDPDHDKRTRKIRESLSQYVAGVAVLIGVLVSLNQSATTSINFQQDFRERLHHDKRDELLTATGMLAGSSEAGRVSGVYSLAELMNVDPSDPAGPQISTAVFNSLVAFVKFRQSLDGNQGAEKGAVPIDVQAAITVLGTYTSRPSYSSLGNAPEVSMELSNLALIGADFRNGNFDNALFMSSKLSGANFSGASLKGANFTNSDLGYRSRLDICKYGEEFNPQDLWDPRNQDYTSHSLQTIFSNANANGAWFYSANLNGVRFDAAKLHGAKFGNADLGWAEFSADTEFESGELNQACESSPTKPASVGAALKQCAKVPALPCTGRK